MNCKIGDLAIVVISKIPENIGRIVEIVRPAVRGIDFHPGNPDVPTWIVKSPRPLAIQSFTTGKLKSPSCERPLQDRCLLPVSGLSMTDDITDEVKA